MKVSTVRDELPGLLNKLEKRFTELRAGIKSGELSPEDAMVIISELLKVLEPSEKTGLPLPIRRELTALTDVMERERRRMARMIREVGNVLADTSVEITTLLKLVKDLPPEIAQGLQSLKESLDAEVKNLKRTLAWLQPLNEFARMGLRDGLEYFASVSLAGLPVQVTFSLQEVPERLPAVMASALFRILQEALFYSCYHAEAREVEIRFKQEPGFLTFIIVNDGAPFDETRAETLSSLILIQEQTRWLGGECKFYSSKEGKNKLVIRIPFAL